MNLRKVSIIGDGAVGSSIAFSLAGGHAVNEIVIVDLNHDKAEGDALDIADGMSLPPGRLRKMEKRGWIC